MIVSQRIARSPQVIRPARITEQAVVESRVAGRIVQISLALYLLPALLIVLAVGCLGMLVLGGGRLLCAPRRALPE
jgi:hypothetical protein